MGKPTTHWRKQIERYLVERGMWGTTVAEAQERGIPLKEFSFVMREMVQEGVVVRHGAGKDRGIIWRLSHPPKRGAQWTE